MEGTLALRSPFFDRLRQAVHDAGGAHNAHLHLDRAYTLDLDVLDGSGITENSHLSLQEKHSLISSLHGSKAYTEEGLTDRLSRVIGDLEEAGTRLADTVIDVTDDGVGLRAIRAANSCAARAPRGIHVRTGAYNPLGFPSGNSSRWELLEEGAKEASFIGALPERDQRNDYPDHIGFEESCVRVIDLGKRLGKFLHIHTDQRNQPTEDATERLVQIVRREGSPTAANGETTIWAVHVISPSTYDEARFKKLVDGLLECNIGVICCPTGALGMRQLRTVSTPTYNSIARVLEFVAAGVPVRLGSDNIADMCSPSTTADLIDEAYILSSALRYYDIGVLAKLVAGQPFDEETRARVADHLQRNAHEIEKLVSAPAAVS